MNKENKGQESKTKRYRDKKTRTKIQGPKLEADTNFKSWCSGLEGYIFDLGPIASDKFARAMKDLERYLGVNYINICQTAIMNETPHPYLTQICKQSHLQRTLMVPRRTQIWPTSKIRTLTRPYVRNWGIRMCMKLTCKISTILLWVRKMRNYSRRQHRTPYYRWKRQAKIPLCN